MNAHETLEQRYAIHVVPIPKTPHWYNVRFDPAPHSSLQQAEGSDLQQVDKPVSALLSDPTPNAIVAMGEEASFVRWNQAPFDESIPRKVYEAEACHQVTAEHQKRHAL